ALTADGRTLAASAGSDVTFWDVATGKELGKLSAGEQGVVALALSPDGKAVATRGPAGGEVHLWDRASGKLLHALIAAAPEVAGNQGGVVVTSVTGLLSTELVFSPDGRYLAGAGPKRQVCLWDVVSGNTVWEQELPGDQTIDRFAFTDSGLALA